MVYSTTQDAFIGAIQYLIVDLRKFMAWQLYFHYVLLVLAIFLFIHPLSGPLEDIAMTAWIGWVYLFLWYLFWIFVADTIIHLTLGYYTGWKD